MATTTMAQENNFAAATTVQIGVVSGLVGGGIFGVQMLLAEMMPMIASMIGAENIVIGFIIHLLISAFIGGTFGFIASYIPNNLLTLVGAGVGYGIVWWVLGALLIMPAVLGMNEMIFNVGPAQGSLIGHTVFGLVMGVVYYVLISLEHKNA